ncbi:hypothetical protein NEUTE1DRAFT_116306 [Neurospora tetrasperma FGSC 2508]|uniref:Uncharacterized protein n=1 Tax=Neurospora tetrasperma (strain FGSC 2508 / ATCC MYA-4615 / P0657) TaxID=510951 RepID=F8MI54_NEUT8|nr:uncharacterized protein NEUTE1DRAFT_116306 [Neurospora tetrasperma FGSC 2508]EGO58910.1 hypothetical protein NEUTE1DRAFT_116306 [Neurospora tetrasperma FGSC 2508]EGZ73010.1 hypothetical protein NEUTE2DRAFT_144001 [Neurospora tetrasperma FGSC 2509]
MNIGILLRVRAKVKCPLVKYPAQTTTGNGSFVALYRTLCGQRSSATWPPTGFTYIPISPYA